MLERTKKLKRLFSLIFAVVMTISLVNISPLLTTAQAAPGSAEYTALVAEAASLLDGRAASISGAMIAVADGTTEAQVPVGFNYVTWTEWKNLSRALAAAKKETDGEKAADDLQNAVDAFQAAVKTGTKINPASATATLVFHYLETRNLSWFGTGWDGVGWKQDGVTRTDETSIKGNSGQSVNGMRFVTDAPSFNNSNTVKAHLNGVEEEIAGNDRYRDVVPYLQFLARTYTNASASSNYIHFLLTGNGSNNDGSYMYFPITMMDVEVENGIAYKGIPSDINVFTYPAFSIPESTGFGAIRWEIIGGKNAAGDTLTAAQASAIAEINSDAKTILGKAEGEVTIRASVVGGMSNTSAAISRISRDIIVKIEEPVDFVPVTSVKLNKNSAYMRVDVLETLTANVGPSNATSKHLTWTSSNPSIASVSQTGVVTPIFNGTVTIRAASVTNPEVYDECVVTVEYDTLALAVTPEVYSGLVGLNWVAPSGSSAPAGYKVYRDDVEIGTITQGKFGTFQNVTPKAMNLSPDGTFMMAADPSRPNEVYAFPASDGCWKSEDYGVTFKKISTTSAMNSGMSWGLLVDPDPNRPADKPLTIYTTRGYGSMGLWKSVDGGVTWTNVWSNVMSNDGSTNITSQIGNDPAEICLADGYDIDHVVVSLHNNATSELFGVYETTNGGDTWRHWPVPFNTVPHDDCLFTNDGVWYYTRARFDEKVYRSGDGGASWQLVHTTSGYGTVGTSKITINNAIIAAGHATAVYSTNNGQSWTNFGNIGDLVGAMWMSNDRVYAIREIYGTGTVEFKSALIPTSGLPSFTTDSFPSGFAKPSADPAVTIFEGKSIAVTGHNKKGLLRFVERNDGVIEFFDGGLEDDTNYLYSVAAYDSTGRITSKTTPILVNSGDAGLRPSAVVSDEIVSGTQNETSIHGSVKITLDNAEFTQFDDIDVTSWFGSSIPDGITALIQFTSDTEAVITFNGIATVAFDRTMAITIPSNVTDAGSVLYVTTNNNARFVISPISYTVTFDANGGTPATQTRTVNHGLTIGTLPVVNRSGYELVGWFDTDAATGGIEITGNTVITGNKTIYARWNKIAVLDEIVYTLNRPVEFDPGLGNLDWILRLNLAEMFGAENVSRISKLELTIADDVPPAGYQIGGGSFWVGLENTAGTKIWTPVSEGNWSLPIESNSEYSKVSGSTFQAILPISEALAKTLDGTSVYRFEPHYFNWQGGSWKYVSLKAVLREASEPEEPTSVFALSSASTKVNVGGKFDVSAAFDNVVESNIATLSLTYDAAKYKYNGFTAADGVSVLDTRLSEGRIRLTVSVADYATLKYGDFNFTAIAAVVLDDPSAAIIASVDYVVRDSEGVKTIKNQTAALGVSADDLIPGDVNGDGKVNLIDLSNLLELLGKSSGDADWDEYAYFDFDESGIIDDFDILYLAKIIDLTETGIESEAKLSAYAALSNDSDVVVDAVDKDEDIFVNITFDKPVETNAYMLNIEYNTEYFEYKSYGWLDSDLKAKAIHQENGTNSVTLIAESETALLNMGYVVLRAKDDIDLNDPNAQIKVTVTMVETIDSQKAITHSSAIVNVDADDDVFGDINGDGVFDLIDLSDLIDSFGLTEGEEGWDLVKEYDMDSDGVIGIYDIAILAGMLN